MTSQSPATAPSVSDDTPKSAHGAERVLKRIEQRLFISPQVFGGVVRLVELSLLIALSLTIASLYAIGPTHVVTQNYLFASLAAAVGCSVLLQAFDLYTVPVLSAPVRHLGRVWLAWSVALVGLVFAMFFLKRGADFSRFWVASWYVGGLVLLAAIRFGVASVTAAARSRGLLLRNAVIYGSGPAVDELMRSLAADPHSDIRVCGVFDDRAAERDGSADAQIAGNVDRLLDIARKGRLDMVIMALPLAAEARVSAILKRLYVLPVDVRLAANVSALQFRPRNYSYVGNTPMLDLTDKPLADWGGVQKWLFDKVIATLAIIALAPVMAIVALAVKLESRGPVIFRQKRYGFNNELVEVFKFRSMYTDMTDATASKLVTKDDPRVTKVGRIIRKTSLDELPQFFNVLNGTLSLVGPRPHAVHAKAANKLYPDVVDGYFARHKVKPGITGWAQINGWRGETDTPEKIQKRVEHDIYYIENWSVWLDLYILLKTPGSLIKNENAY
ncbi:MAG TPA: undecaprenyl-phosphate glucose phosphotransferase [Hyphomicrobiaceae bacterium]|nr:undecaprenyl-phosphate glucose phosphotransferase [Hyphomicrobiaceae bacterium]